MWQVFTIVDKSAYLPSNIIASTNIDISRNGYLFSTNNPSFVSLQGVLDR